MSGISSPPWGVFDFRRANGFEYAIPNRERFALVVGDDDARSVFLAIELDEM
jgi:hypothetical protein